MAQADTGADGDQAKQHPQVAPEPAEGQQMSAPKVPNLNRHCTDCPCCIAIIVAQVGFVMVTLAGFQDGDPVKLLRPRDFRGDYCGMPASKQFREAAELEEYGSLVYSMNVTGAVGDLAQELVCSSAAEEAVSDLLTASQMEQYRCACCKTPCSSCQAVLPFEDHMSMDGLTGGLTGKLRDFTDASKVLELFSPTGANGGALGGIFSQIDKYLVATCLKSCSPTQDNMRNYTYSPSHDMAWKTAWDALKHDTRLAYAPIARTIQNEFTFKALSSEECGYDADYCVPMPGMSFNDLHSGWCAPEMAADLVDTISSEADSGFLGDLSSQGSETFGTAMGDTIKSMDVLAVVAVCALVYSFVYLVLIRFFLAPVVWLSLLVVFILLQASGAAAYVSSFQCSGDSLVQTGSSYAEALQTRAEGEVQAARDGESTVTFNVSDETLTGSGVDYRGGQMVTKHGKICQRWDSQYPHNHSMTSTRLPDADLRDNYCRNPGGEAVYIWCYTTDAATRWELCRPLGASALDRDCPNGYSIKDDRVRKVVYIAAFICWTMGLLWLLIVCCLCKKIRLAIAVQKVAAMFVYTTPQIILVPLIETIVTGLWCGIWFFCAAFLVSQVSDAAVPTGFYNYTQAWGTDTVPGTCNGAWPTGFAWRYTGNITSEDDDCSGRLGDTSGIEPKCWRCAPPRFALDLRFLASFFVFLWNSEFLIATGQCVIAGACAFWFFRPANQEGEAPMRSGVVSKSVRNVFRYHVGSLAFGAAVIATVQLIRYIMMYIEKNAAQQKNTVVVYVMKVMQCCMWCLEKCLKFLNKNAYIQIAIRGTSFCTSAMNAFQLILSNMASFATIGFLGHMAQYIGVAVIMVGTMITGFLILELMDPEVSPIAPMAMIFLFSYVVSNAFMDIFGLAIDSMHQCFLIAEAEKVPDVNIPEQLKNLRAKHFPGKGAQDKE